tara:strand:- start:200 stop:409 length:210 start_codon:yes stop_codon:yes gene_type:complete
LLRQNSRPTLRLTDYSYINIISKASEIYSDLLTQGLLFVDGANSDPSKEKIYVDALQKALMSLYSTNLE